MTGFHQVSVSIDEVKRRTAPVAGVGAVLCVLGYFFNQEQFFRSYLLGYLVWISIALGALAVVMIHHLTGGGWGHAIRPVLRAATRTLPVFLLLFIPILFGMHHLYIWTDVNRVAQDEVLQDKSGYLNTGFFLMRTAVYFAIWIGCAWGVGRTESGPDAPQRVRRVSAAGLVLYGLTVTFASIDWVMSLEPHWYSTIYGMSFAVGQMLAGIAFAVVMLVVMRNRSDHENETERLHDLGNLLLALVMMWAYLAFSQYLIIWSGNQTSEIAWYAIRGSGGWGYVVVIVIAFHFVLPFLLLLSRRIKQMKRSLAGLALGILVFRWVDLFWITAPAFHPSGFSIHWLDIVAPITVGALWLAAFARCYGMSPGLGVRQSGFTS